MPRANNTKYTPSRWPTDLEYLHSMSYSPSVPRGVLEHLKGIGTSPPPVSNPSSVTIRHIDDMMHPAYRQMGLFASKKIMSNTLIIDYFGEVHADERIDSDYDLSLYRTQDCGGVVNIGACVNFLLIIKATAYSVSEPIQHLLLASKSIFQRAFVGEFTFDGLSQMLKYA